MNKLLRFFSSISVFLAPIALLAIVACFVYLAVAQPAQFSFMGLHFENQNSADNDKVVGLESDLRLLESDLAELKTKHDTLDDQRLEQTRNVDRIDANSALMKDDLDRVDIELDQLKNNFVKLSATIESIIDDAKKIKNTQFDSVLDVKEEIETLYQSFLENSSYVRIFKDDLVAVLSTGGRDPLGKIDEHFSQIAKSQPDLLNFPGIYICPQTQSLERNWHLVYGDYTSGFAAERIKLITKELHHIIGAKPPLPYPKNIYHKTYLNEVCIDGKDWIAMTKNKKQELICDLDRYEEERLEYCNKATD